MLCVCCVCSESVVQRTTKKQRRCGLQLLTWACSGRGMPRAGLLAPAGSARSKRLAPVDGTALWLERQWAGREPQALLRHKLSGG